MSLDAKELQRLISSADSSALLVPPRILRRIIKVDRELGGPGLQVPHRKTYVLESEALLQIASREELGVTSNRKLPKIVVLLERPESDWLKSRTKDEVLTEYWRLLFHARIDQETRKQIRNGKLNEKSANELILQLGLTVLEEATAVLRQELFLLPPYNSVTILAELIAVFLEFHRFERRLLNLYFPAIEDYDKTAELLDIVEADRLLKTTRLKGAPAPVMRKGFTEETGEKQKQTLKPADCDPNPAKSEALRHKAELSTKRGNVVRAAILLKHALDLAPPEKVATIQEEIRKTLDQLAYRLHAALELHDKETEEWLDLLPALLEPASRGTWSVSARLLYDLQKVCVDHERDIYAMDLGANLRSFGRKPMRRLLPHYAHVLLVKHLRTAAARLAGTPVDDEQRRRLAIILRAAVHHSEQRLRERIRPILTETLDEVGLIAESFPEEVARKKMVEEMLDRITEWGFLSMSDVRDAISRNEVKLPDFSGPMELFQGDQLLQIDRRLRKRLDGIYRRGEIYLRILQRMSAVTFGTRVGRWLSLFVFLPFGGAYGTIIFMLEMLHLAGVGYTITVEQMGSAVGGSAAYLLKDEGALKVAFQLPGSVVLWMVGVLGVFFLLLMHVPIFRRWVWEGLCWTGRALYKLFLVWPGQLMEIEFVKRVLSSTAMMLFRRYLMRALIATLVVGLITVVVQPRVEVVGYACGIAFVVSMILFNSRLGRDVDEALTDWAIRNWDCLRADVIPGLIHYTMAFFKRCLDSLEKLIYSVDEWLRFRTGDNKWSMLYKPFLGLIWRILTYALRVMIALFVEPTFNPIKHFPVVTVAAKIMVPLLIMVPGLFQETLGPIVGIPIANLLAGLVIFFLPGLAGFIAWELKENWKLYQANRSSILKPVVIGSHGETMKRFLKPGFHSGTLPSLFARLRKAERQHNGRAFFKHHEALHHVVEDIRHFVEREMVMLLEASKGWGDVPMYVGMMNLASNRVGIEVCSKVFGQRGFWIAFELRSDRLIASISGEGWIPRLKPIQKQVLHIALGGLYKLVGVDLIDEDLRSKLPDETIHYRLDENEIFIWKDKSLMPVQVEGMRLEEALFTQKQITWEMWVEIWKRDKENDLKNNSFLTDVQILP